MYEVVGYRFVDMKSDDGSQITGYSCYLLNHSEKNGLTGAEALKQFFRQSDFPEFVPELGMKLRLYYDDRRKLIDYKLL